MKQAILASITFLFLTIVLAAPTSAAEIEPNFAAYLETLGDDDFVSAIVYLQDRPDIGSLDNTLRGQRVPLSVRHSQVLVELKQAAERSQPVMLDYLGAREMGGSVKGYTPYWIMNLIVVSATKAEILRIADRADVEAIEGNFKTVLIENVDAPYTGSPITGIGVTNSLYAINADRITSELGWEPSFDFENGLRATVEWYLENSAWCKTVMKDRYDGGRLGLNN